MNDKVCVLSVFGIGNAIDKIPMLRLLQDSGCYITVIQDVAGRGVFEEADFIHNLEYYNPTEKKFETEHIDIEYDYCISAIPSNGWMKDIVRYKQLIGVFDDYRDFSQPDWKSNLVLSSYFFSNTIEIYNKIPDLYFPLKEPVKKEYSGWLGIHPGGSKHWPWKRMHTSVWKGLYYDLMNDHDIHCNFFGNYQDYESGCAGESLNYWISTLHEGVSRFICDNLTLQDTARLMLKGCDVFISNDSGLMHLSASLGIPTIGLFGPTSSIKNSPFSRNFTSYSRGLSCSPCQHDWNKMVHCPFDRECLYLDINILINIILKKFKKI